MAIKIGFLLANTHFKNNSYKLKRKYYAHIRIAQERAIFTIQNSKFREAERNTKIPTH